MEDRLDSTLAQQLSTHAPNQQQLSAIKAVRNDVIGHQQRKEKWIGRGILEPLHLILEHGAVEERDVDGSTHSGLDLYLHALSLIGSLAHGCTAFLSAPTFGSVFSTLLSCLCLEQNVGEVTLAALHAICEITNTAQLLPGDHVASASMLANQFFQQPYATCISKILGQSGTEPITSAQIAVTMDLVSLLCREEWHRAALTSAGALDTLASHLAGSIVLHGPGVAQPDRMGSPSNVCEPSWPTRLLHVIAVIVANSRYRATRLIYSNALLSVLYYARSLARNERERVNSPLDAVYASSISLRISDMDTMSSSMREPHSNLPWQTSGLRSYFPATSTSLGGIDHITRGHKSKPLPWPRITSFDAEVVANQDGAEDRVAESQLIDYLIWLARSSSGVQRLMAISVLTVLYRAGLASRIYDTALGFLIVPLLLQMLNNCQLEDTMPHQYSSHSPFDTPSWVIQERVPAILAVLIGDSECLQQAAYDADAAESLSRLLILAYEPVIDTEQSSVWSPSIKDQDRVLHGSSRVVPTQSGALPPLLLHKIRIRESTLAAISALASFKDEFRKALIAQEIVPFIVESLHVFPAKPIRKSPEKLDSDLKKDAVPRLESFGYGINPVSVLIAACGAVRHLSRSISVLRTTLIDHGVIQPIFALLQHTDIEVQIAATATVCNLVTEISPMRDTIGSATVSRILCEHAHSSNVKLRLNALWALKHLVFSADNIVKKACLEELGQGWLVQLICDDTEDNTTSAPHYGGTMASQEGHAERIESEQIGGDDNLEMQVDEISIGRQFPDMREKTTAHAEGESSAAAASRHKKARYIALKELEIDPAERARRDELAVQEQGLEFIRNLIVPQNPLGSSEPAEMIDHLLNSLGQDQLFEILMSKLRPRGHGSFDTEEPTGSSDNSRRFRPQAAIVAAVGYILVHMAASIPRHRQLLIAQTDLLRLLVPQFDNPAKEVRVALCWLTVNLTSKDDAGKDPSCLVRAEYLRRIGFLTKLESLEQDSDLDVRERAKTAVYQMKNSTTYE